jgi:hypothetical protein
LHDDCRITDSVGAVLEPRRERLSRWNVTTLYAMRAFCEGVVEEGVSRLEQRYHAYSRSASAQAHYAWVLLGTNHQRAAVGILERLDPERDLGWWDTPADVWPRYWWRLAGARHALREYSAELDVTDRWQDSAASEWQLARGRALAALGQEGAVKALVRNLAAAETQLAIAAELSVHGHPAVARAVAESVLTQHEREPMTDWRDASAIASAHRLLGRTVQERLALEIVAQSDVTPLTKLEAKGRIAVLLADTAAAWRVDSTLAEGSDRPLRSAWARGPEILARARIAAGLGRRERAVALLQDARARGLLDLGSSYAFHSDLLLAPLRGYAPFDALLEPDD